MYACMHACTHVRMYVCMCMRMQGLCISVADSGGGPGPPPLGKKKNVKGLINGKLLALPPPLMNRVASGLWRARKNESRASRRLYGDHGQIMLLPPPPTESRRLWEITGKFCYYPPPTASRRPWETTENSATTPPPTESRRRLGTSHERGRPLGKSWICDCICRGICM